MHDSRIIANGIVLTCDSTNRCGRFHIAIEGGSIVAIAENLESLAKKFPDASVIDATGKLVLPGFVNAHYHGESFLLRALTKGIHFGLWKDDEQIKQVYDKLLHSTSHDDIRRIYLAAYLAHLKSGTTCVGEFPPQLDEDSLAHLLESIASTGITCVATLRSWDHIRKVQAMREKKPRSAVSLGSEQDFTVYSIEKIAQAAKELRAPLVAHIGEQRDDVEIVRKNFQKSILTLLNSFNAIRQNTIIVHANHASDDEVTMLKELGGTVTVCARSTAAKQTGYPAIRQLAKRHVRMAIGSDWGNVDMIEEMRFMSQLPLLVPGLRPFSSVEILRMATINGAVALGLQSELGSIEVGKRADFVFLATGDIRMPVLYSQTSAEELADAVVHECTTANIADVMIHGAFCIKDNRAVSLYEPTIVEEFRSTHKKLVPDALVHRMHTPPHTDGHTPNVLPFVAERAGLEGFETGFPATPTRSEPAEFTEQVPPPFLNRTKIAREPIKPELPKDTRRIFGEDDDV